MTAHSNTPSIPHERICGIDLYGIYRKGNNLFRVVAIADSPTMTLENIETGERVGGVIGAPIFDGFVELVPRGEKPV